MKYTRGLDLAKRFYAEYGLPMLKNEFGDKLPKIATGLCGHGSECFGFDDEISVDHDFEPGFCIWLTDEDEQDFGFKLMRAYTKLPKEFEGLKLKESSIYGTRGKGVHTIWDYYSFYLGMRRLPDTNEEWLRIPSFYLAEAVNGEVFSDPLGEFSRIRNAIINDVPSDVWNKKLGSELFDMAQKGQYNYSRCLEHGQRGAAIFSLNDYVKALISCIYILNRKHMPYYKWSIKGMENLSLFSELKPEIENALIDPMNANDFIENSSSLIKDHLVKELNVKDSGDYLEGYAYAVNELIEDHMLRNSPIML